MAKLKLISFVESASGKLDRGYSVRTINGKPFTYKWDKEKHPYALTPARQIHTLCMRLVNREINEILNDPERLAPYEKKQKSHPDKRLRDIIYMDLFPIYKADLLARFANDEPAFQAYLATLNRK